jgi:hypothetical protein
MTVYLAESVTVSLTQLSITRMHRAGVLARGHLALIREQFVNTAQQE